MNLTKSFPKIKSWKFIKFSPFFFDIELNFINRDKISSTTVQKDTLKVKAISNQPFVSRASGFKLKQNFTTEAIIVRSYARKEDEDFIKTVASTMTASSSISLLIPLFFNTILSAKMNRAWSFYLLMQVLSNIYLYSVVAIP